MNKGQGLIEYFLLLVLIATIVIVVLSVIVGLTANQLPCDVHDPTAGQVVDCIATRTAEARNR